MCIYIIYYLYYRNEYAIYKHSQGIRRRCFDFSWLEQIEIIQNSIIAGNRILEKKQNIETLNHLILSPLSSGWGPVTRHQVCPHLKLPPEVPVQYCMFLSKLFWATSRNASAVCCVSFETFLSCNTLQFRQSHFCILKTGRPSWPKKTTKITPSLILACIQCSHCSPPSCSPIQCTCWSRTQEVCQMCRKGKSGASAKQGRYCKQAWDYR